jgi:Na+/melibiose symporter-like transporter
MMVERQSMGSATATLQFARSIGGAIGVGVMGAFLNWRAQQAGMGAGLEMTFAVAAAITLLGLAITFAAPHLSADEMKNLRESTTFTPSTETQEY